MPWGDCTGPWWAQGGRAPRRGRGFGWGRGGYGWGYGPWWADETDYTAYDKETEKNYLKARESWLKRALEAIQQRLRDLGEAE